MWCCVLESCENSTSVFARRNDPVYYNLGYTKRLVFCLEWNEFWQKVGKVLLFVTTVSKPAMITAANLFHPLQGNKSKLFWRITARQFRLEYDSLVRWSTHHISCWICSPNRQIYEHEWEKTLFDRWNCLDNFVCRQNVINSFPINNFMDIEAQGQEQGHRGT